MRKIFLTSLSVLLVLGLACDSVTPVAPTGTTLTISASPTEIGLNGSASVTVVLRRENGTPVNPGTEVRFDSTLGTITETAQTDPDGVARATLRGDGRIGTATVTARSGASEAATIDVVIGENASSISLQATPSSVPDSGGTVRLLALVRDKDGQPLANATINFQTDAGTLDSGGGFLTTDANGEGRDTLRVNDTQLGSLSTDFFEVSVEASGDSGIVTDTFQIRIDRPLRADFTFSVSGLSVAFTDQSTGEPTTWQWDFGDGQTSSLRNTTHTYQAPGDYSVTLTIRNNRGGSDVETKTVRVEN